MYVWDPLVRLAHWTLVSAVCVAWLSMEDIGLPHTWHEPAGYVAAAVVLTRTVWGLIGRGHARFTSFVRSPQAVLTYGQQVLRHAEPRYIGHNPLGGWMVIALLACVAGIACTGWLQTTDRYWGSELLEVVHRSLAWGLLGLVTLHVSGVVFTSLRHKESLVRAMITGRKPVRSELDIH